MTLLTMYVLTLNRSERRAARKRPRTASKPDLVRARNTEWSALVEERRARYGYQSLAVCANIGPQARLHSPKFVSTVR